MKIKPLIAIPSPRTIPEVIQAFGNIKKYDKLWLKFMREHEAYPQMRDMFLNHPTKKYTHLVICPDDLLLDDIQKLEYLFDDYNKFDPKERDNIIMSGYCNVDHSAYAAFANVTTIDVSPYRQGRTYMWKTLFEMDLLNKENPNGDYLLRNVKFAGFPLFVIPRKIVEEVPFRNDSATGKFDSHGCCVDVMFCCDAIHKGYEICVDTRVHLKHLKISDAETGQMLFKLIYDPHTQVYPHKFIEYAEEEEKSTKQLLH